MSEPITHPNSNRILRAAIWVAIGALIAAAIVCVVWVLVGDANGMIGKAFLTIMLLAGFAGIAILEANLAPRRPAWFALASMVSWVAILMIGAFLIWMPTADEYFGRGVERFTKFVLIVLIVQGALLHVRLFSKAHQRYRTTFTTIVTYVTIGLVVILAVMLVLPIMVEEYVEFRSFYWRVVVALAILAAVGTALVPLVNALFAPKKPRPVAPAAQSGYGAVAQAGAYPPVAQWPTYADGRTPLPVLPDGTPDWNAYYTGRPTYPQGYEIMPPPTGPAAASGGGPAQAPASAVSEEPADSTAPSARGTHPAPSVPPGYQGYPPPPPPPL